MGGYAVWFKIECKSDDGLFDFATMEDKFLPQEMDAFCGYGNPSIRREPPSVITITPDRQLQVDGAPFDPVAWFGTDDLYDEVCFYTQTPDHRQWVMKWVGDRITSIVEDRGV